MIRGQRVRRVVRRIDTWSVLRVAVLFYLSLMLVIVLAGVMLWIAGSVFGAIEGMESFMRGIGFDGFEFVGGQLLRGFTAVGLILVVLGTGATVLATLLYNLIADVVGGVQLTVLEEVYVPDESRLPVTIDAAGEEWAVAAAPVEAVEAAGAPPAGPLASQAGGEPETVAEPEPVTVAEPEPVTVAEPEPVTVAEPEPETVAEPEPETMAPAGAVHVESVPEAEAVSEPADDPDRDRVAEEEVSRPGGWTTPAWQPASRAQWSDTGEAS